MVNRAAASYQGIGRWDTLQVTTMRLMFASAVTFNQDIGRWDLSEMLRNYMGAPVCVRWATRPPSRSTATWKLWKPIYIYT